MRPLAGALVLLASNGWSALGLTPATADPRGFTLIVPPCTAEPLEPQVRGYRLNTAPPGELVEASQLTEAALCYTESGLEVVFTAVEQNTFSTADECNAPVWEHGNAMELFIAPVRDAWDIPSQYQEIDGAPSGSSWGACIEAEDVCPGCANATDATCAVAGGYECADPGPGGDLGRFTNGVIAAAELVEGGWRLRLTVPWTVFSDWAQPQAPDLQPWRHCSQEIHHFQHEIHHLLSGLAPGTWGWWITLSSKVSAESGSISFIRRAAESLPIQLFPRDCAR